MNSLPLFMWKSFISSSFLKYIDTGFKMLCWWLFFQQFNDISLLPCGLHSFSSLLSFLSLLLCIFLLANFKTFLFNFGFQWFKYEMSRFCFCFLGVSMCVFDGLSSLGFSELIGCVIWHIVLFGENYWPISLEVFSILLSSVSSYRKPILYLLGHSILIYTSWMLYFVSYVCVCMCSCLFAFILFSLCVSLWIHFFPIFSFTSFSTFLNWLIRLSKAFLNLFYCFSFLAFSLDFFIVDIFWNLHLSCMFSMFH